MTTYTIEIFLAGLLAFAASEGPNGEVTKVTLLVPEVQGQGNMADHVPFVLWPENVAESGDCDGEVSQIFTKLGLREAPPQWGGCILRSDEISLSGVDGNLKPFRFDTCSMGPVPLSEFCWVPVVSDLAGDDGLGKVDENYLVKSVAETGDLAARFAISHGSLQTFHLAEADGSVYAFKSVANGGPTGSFYRVMADIAVLRLQVPTGKAVAIQLAGQSTRSIKIQPAEANQTRRLVIGNLPPKKTEDSTHSSPEDATAAGIVVRHFGRFYDISENSSSPAERPMPFWSRDFPHWPNQYFGNPDFDSMAEPLATLHQRYSETVGEGIKTLFQREICPMATFKSSSD